MPKVSVIIPVYGVERYIERCARSLFGQTLDDIEFIFVDDCTEDRSISVLSETLQEYSDRKDSVHIYRMPSNSGQAAVRKYGIQKASGEYVIFCDSDDWVDVTMYEKMYTEAKSRNADVIICDFQNHDGERTLSYGTGYRTDRGKMGMLWDFAKDKIPWAVWNKLVRRELYADGMTFPEADMGEDMVMVMQIFARDIKFCHIPEPLYCYFVNPNSIMHPLCADSAINRFKQLIMNVCTLNEVMAKEGMSEKYHEIVDYLYFRASNMLVPFLNSKEAKDQWKRHLSGRHLQVLSNPHISFPRKVRHVYLLIRIRFM